jgi:hypothetical protein
MPNRRMPGGSMSDWSLYLRLIPRMVNVVNKFLNNFKELLFYSGTHTSVTDRGETVSFWDARHGAAGRPTPGCSV